ncbi:MAG: alkaline phosphatase family protein [Rhizobiales bacterium]|nr:alkaline phosphatase family protein [Hyphomicrobiales bacterium]
MWGMTLRRCVGNVWHLWRKARVFGVVLFAAALPALAETGADRPALPVDPITRVAFASCFVQSAPAPIWQSVRARAPDLLVMMGDNVYGDTRSGTTRELEDAYRAAAAHPDFNPVLTGVPVLATWDDHDYGRNDGGAEYELRLETERLFRAFWRMPGLPPEGEGIYSAHMLGTEGSRLHVILLDVRSFRSPLKRKPEGSAIVGRYVEQDAPGQDMLGAAQWAWLERELARPADLKVLVSGIQVLAEGHGWERWGNLPDERRRLLELVDRMGTGPLLVLSGDRHNGSFYERPAADGRRRIVEVTSSPISRPYPNEDAAGPEKLGTSVEVENFGLLEIDWARRIARVGLHLADGSPAREPMEIGF